MSRLRRTIVPFINKEKRSEVPGCKMTVTTVQTADADTVPVHPVDLHLSKALFSLEPDNLQLHCFFKAGSIILLFVLLCS